MGDNYVDTARLNIDAREGVLQLAGATDLRSGMPSTIFPSHEYQSERTVVTTTGLSSIAPSFLNLNILQLHAWMLWGSVERRRHGGFRLSVAAASEFGRYIANWAHLAA